MKRMIPMILMIILPYAFISFLVIVANYRGNFAQALYSSIKILLVFLIAVVVLNLIYPFIFMARKASSRELLFWDMLIKLCNIPIYALAFLIGLTGFLFIKFLAISLILAIFDYLLLLSSTMYGVCGLLQARREGKIESVTAVLGIILHFIFVLDVINAIVMYIKVRKYDNAQEEQNA